MEAVRSGGDLTNIGGESKYSKTIVCPDGCVMFRLTATPLGDDNFFRGRFYEKQTENRQKVAFFIYKIQFFSFCLDKAG